MIITFKKSLLKATNFLYLFLFSLFFSNYYCFAQCDNQLKPDNGIFHYKHRSGDERCEGTYVKYRSGENLRFVSFTIDSVYYTNGSGGKLEINVPFSDYHQQVNVQGNNFNTSAQNNTLAYRLDMTLSEGTKKLIPLEEVINRIPINYNHLGFYGFVYQSNQQTYIPVSAVEQDPYNHSSIKWAKKDYVIIFTSQIHFDEMSYSLMTQESKPKVVIDNELLAQNLRPDQVLRILISRKKLLNGIHNYVLKIKYKSGTVDVIPYYLFIP